MTYPWSIPLVRVGYGTMVVLGGALLIRNPPPLWAVAVALFVGGWVGYSRMSDGPEDTNIGAKTMTFRKRLRRAVRAFRDYPGRRVDDGGEPGVLVVCGEPYGCGGSGVMHQPDRVPDPVEPTEGTTP